MPNGASHLSDLALRYHTSHAESESASGLTSAVAVSASTLAEDVRQLAKWCRSADDAREQQEQRLEQLEAMPPLHSQLKALQEKAWSLHTLLAAVHHFGFQEGTEDGLLTTSWPGAALPDLTFAISALKSTCLLLQPTTSNLVS